MTKIHPAIAEHAMEENERLRGLLRELREITSEYAWDADLESRVDAALSKQAEPVCDTCHGQGEVWTGENQSFGYMSMQPPEPIMEFCPECGGEEEPAPAQDEQQPVAEPATALDGRAIRLLAELSRAPQEGEKVSRDRMSAIIEVGHDRAAFIARLARPAQTEQQPVAWVEVKDRHEGPYEFHGIELLDSGKHDLFIAPIANPTPQGKFRIGDRVRKTSGSEWVGKVVGWYSTSLTPEGYAVESEAHAGSVQIYPAKALEAVE